MNKLIGRDLFRSVRVGQRRIGIERQGSLIKGIEVAGLHISLHHAWGIRHGGNGPGERGGNHTLVAIDLTTDQFNRQFDGAGIITNLINQRQPLQGCKLRQAIEGKPGAGTALIQLIQRESFGHRIPGQAVGHRLRIRITVFNRDRIGQSQDSIFLNNGAMDCDLRINDSAQQIQGQRVGRCCAGEISGLNQQ